MESSLCEYNELLAFLHKIIRVVNFHYLYLAGLTVCIHKYEILWSDCVDAQADQSL